MLLFSLFWCNLPAVRLLCSKFKNKEVGVTISLAAPTSCHLQTCFTRNKFSFATAFTVLHLKHPCCKKKVFFWLVKLQCMKPAKIVIQVKMKERSLTLKHYWCMSDVWCFYSSMILFHLFSAVSTVYCMVWNVWQFQG